MNFPSGRTLLSLAMAGAMLSAAVTLRAQTATDVAAQPFAPGVISRPDSGGITFSPDGRTAYFGARVPAGKWGIFVSRLADGHWTQPEVAPFSGVHPDGDPQLAPDGNRLFFYSSRPMAGKPNPNIPALWYVERQGDAWSEARLVGAQDDGSWNPLTLGCGSASPAADGTLYMFRVVSAADHNVRIARSKPIDGRYRELEDLGDTVNGRNGNGGDVVVAPDQRFIIFSASKRPDSLGRSDLYISYRADAGWSEPCNLGPKVNTSDNEYSPTLSPDGRTLFFARKGIRSIPLAACDGVRVQPEAKP